MKIIEENCVERQITKHFTIELDNGVQLHVSKYVRMFEEPFGTSEYEGDWDFDQERGKEKEKYDALTQDMQDEFCEFVEDLDL